MKLGKGAIMGVAALVGIGALYFLTRGTGGGGGGRESGDVLGTGTTPEAPPAQDGSPPPVTYVFGGETVNFPGGGGGPGPDPYDTGKKAATITTGEYQMPSSLLPGIPVAYSLADLPDRAVAQEIYSAPIGPLPKKYASGAEAFGQKAPSELDQARYQATHGVVSESGHFYPYGTESAKKATFTETGKEADRAAGGYVFAVGGISTSRALSASEKASTIAKYEARGWSVPKSAAPVVISKKG